MQEINSNLAVKCISFCVDFVAICIHPDVIRKNSCHTSHQMTVACHRQLHAQSPCFEKCPKVICCSLAYMLSCFVSCHHDVLEIASNVKHLAVLLNWGHACIKILCCSINSSVGVPCTIEIARGVPLLTSLTQRAARMGPNFFIGVVVLVLLCQTGALHCATATSKCTLCGYTMCICLHL